MGCIEFCEGSCHRFVHSDRWYSDRMNGTISHHSGCLYECVIERLTKPYFQPLVVASSDRKGCEFLNGGEHEERRATWATTRRRRRRSVHSRRYTPIGMRSYRSSGVSHSRRCNRVHRWGRGRRWASHSTHTPRPCRESRRSSPYSVVLYDRLKAFRPSVATTLCEKLNLCTYWVAG